MSPSSPQPLNFQPYGPNYSPILMLPLDSYRYHLVAPTGVSGTGVAVPPGARSMRVIALSADVWMNSTTSASNTVTVAVPSTTITNGSVPAQVSGAETFLLPDKCTYVAFISSGNVIVEWFA